MELYNGDCLETMKDLSDNSIDLLFCDLPYGQTSCKWDCLIDLGLFWEQINRICKDGCPMFFTCSTKFGVSLINSNPKNFRYDLVWVKSSPCGFLNAKKMPMKKHEMVYVFYNKLPKVYGECIAEHHKHKFIKEVKNRKGNVYETGKESKDFNIQSAVGKYDPPLPTSVIKDENCYDRDRKHLRDGYLNKQYDPPLPTSVIKDEIYGDEYLDKKVDFKNRNGEPRYDPPLPNSILEVASQKGKHATQKPVDLIKWCLKYYSKEGDVVLDPTMGSGSTGVACKDMNRQFIGVEMDEAIFNVAVERLE
tara:strand:- start:10455 stop:11372 length:918 start_codon:yes stop_codon:yes gene_type:complete